MFPPRYFDGLSRDMPKPAGGGASARKLKELMRPEWEVESATGRCTGTGRAFEEGEEFYTVLIEDGETFRREDYSVEAWQGPPDGSFCHFKTRVPVKEKRKQLLVNDELLLGFFTRLADETEPARVQFRFVLALILMRKRLLRYEGSAMEDGVEVWRMTLPRESSTHRVLDPHLTDDQIESVSQQLSAILHSDMGEWTTMTDETEPLEQAESGDGHETA